MPGSHGMPPALRALDTLEGTVCSVPTLPAGGALRLGTIRARGDPRRWLQSPGFDGWLAPQGQPAWPSAAPQRHRAALTPSSHHLLLRGNGVPRWMQRQT